MTGVLGTKVRAVNVPVAVGALNDDSLRMGVCLFVCFEGWWRRIPEKGGS